MHTTTLQILGTACRAYPNTDLSSKSFSNQQSKEVTGPLGSVWCEMKTCRAVGQPTVFPESNSLTMAR